MVTNFCYHSPLLAREILLANFFLGLIFFSLIITNYIYKYTYRPKTKLKIHKWFIRVENVRKLLFCSEENHLRGEFQGCGCVIHFLNILTSLITGNEQIYMHNDADLVHPPNSIMLQIQKARAHPRTPHLFMLLFLFFFKN